MKDINMQSSLRYKQLQAQVSLIESEKREIEHQLKASSMQIINKDSEINDLKEERTSLQEKVSKLETEKKRMERSYSQMEKEKSSLKFAFEDIQRKSNKTFQNSSRKDNIIDEAKIITQGLAALEQKNIELQKKVMGLQSLMNEAETNSPSNMNTSINCPNGDTPSPSAPDAQKLLEAQKKAQNLLDPKDNTISRHQELDKEVFITVLITKCLKFQCWAHVGLMLGSCLGLMFISIIS